MKTKTFLCRAAVAALSVLPLVGNGEPVKILAIGNSFSFNVPSFLPPLAKDCGVTVDMAALFIGGCTLERHVACLDAAEKDPTSRPYRINYRYESCKGSASPVARLLNDGATNRLQKTKACMANLPEMLKADRWTIVTIQQGSSSSWDYGTYRPYADRLVAAIRKYAPQAEIVVHETWSYNANHFELGGNGRHPKNAKRRWNFDQKGMYDRLHAAYARLASDFGGLRVIPVGTAVQAYRAANPSLPDVVGRSKSDMIHLNMAGNYLQVCTWARCLFGVDVSNVPCRIRDVSPEIAAACRAAASAIAGAKPILMMNEDAVHYITFTASNVPEKTSGKPNELSGISKWRLPPEFTLSKEGVERYIDCVARGRLTHFLINVNYQRAFYPSKVFEPLWVSLDEPEREHRGYVRDLRDAYARGLDVYAVMFARCRARGVSPWLSFRMNDIHGTQVKANPMYSTFWKEHPEWHVGDDSGWANGLDHAQEPVRARMLALMREALERYDADGVEMDIIRFPYYFRKGTERASAPIFTDYVRKIRALCDESAKRRGHPVKLAARLLPTPEEAINKGLAADVWAKEGLVDAIIVNNMFNGMNENPPLEAWHKWTEGKVKIIAGTDSGWSTAEGRRLAGANDYRRWAKNMEQRGADGLYLYNFFANSPTGTTWKAVLEDGVQGTGD